MIGGEEFSALSDTGCELSILKEQLYDKLRPLGLNCLELPTQHLNLVHAFNERSKRIRKQALLEIQIGDSTVDQVVLLFSLDVNRRKIGTRFPDRPCGRTKFSRQYP